MSKVNQLIIEKLEKFDENTVAIGKKALDLAEKFPEQGMADQLESFVRKLVRKNDNEV